MTELSFAVEVSTILLVSSAERDPLAQFEQLIHVSNMPAACQKQQLDPNCHPQIPEAAHQIRQTAHRSRAGRCSPSVTLENNVEGVRAKILLHDLSTGVPTSDAAQPTLAIMRTTFAACRPSVTHHMSM